MTILMRIISLKLLHRFFGQFSKFRKATVAFLITFWGQNHGYIVIHRGSQQPINAQSCHKIILYQWHLMFQPKIWLLLHVLNAACVCEICEIITQCHEKDIQEGRSTVPFRSTDSKSYKSWISGIKTLHFVRFSKQNRPPNTRFFDWNT